MNLQLSAIQALINFTLLDKLHGLLWVVDLHGAVLKEGLVMRRSGMLGGSTYGHVLLLRPSCGFFFRRSALSRLSRFTNSKIRRNDGSRG